MYGIGPPISSPLKSFMDFESGIEQWLIGRGERGLRSYVIGIRH